MQHKVYIMSRQNKKKPLNNYIKYSGLAFQMTAIIVIFVFIGKFADQYFDNKKPVLTAVFSVFGVFLSIYNLIRDVKKSNEE